MLAARDRLLNELITWLDENDIDSIGHFFLRLHVIDMTRPMDVEVGATEISHQGDERVRPGTLPRGRELEIILETDRLQLRPWRVSEAVIQRELWTERDPRVPPHRRLGPDGRPTLGELEDRIRQSPRCPLLGLLAMQRKDAGDVIGYCGLIANTHGQDDEPELAFELLQRFWRQGYATEASRAVLSWATASGYTRLWATVRDWNVASRRALTKVGFVETGRVEPDDVHGDSLFTTKQL